MPDIFVTGLGILNVDQMTREAEQSIRMSREVLFVDNGVATKTYLESLCSNVTDLYDSSYHESGCRLGSYDHMAARVIEAALDHPPVTFAMGGHPVVGVEASFLIQALADVLDLSVVVQPGISAMDCLFAELLVDPCQSGLQMFEATDLLLRQHPLIPEVPALIWQIGAVETRLHTARRSRPVRFNRFLAHVLQFYPATHVVTAYFATQHPLMPSSRLQFPLGEIASHADQLHPGYTLYIPSIGRASVTDLDLLLKIDRQEHLDQITQ